MKVVMVKPFIKVPVEQEIEGELEELRNIVKGYIECHRYRDRYMIVCNEEGKLEGLEPNRALFHNGKPYDYIAGTFIVCSYDNQGELVGLNDSEISEIIEEFTMTQEKIIALAHAIRMSPI